MKAGLESIWAFLIEYQWTFLFSLNKRREKINEKRKKNNRQD